MAGVHGGLYGGSLSLLTDLYQLTMAYGHWKLRREVEGVFHVQFRKLPFEGGYAVAAGLGPALEWVESLRFDETDVAYLATLTGADGKPLFERGFLDWLLAFRPKCRIDAMPEGTVAFAHEPLLRVTGALAECQLLETALLNLVNFSTLVATKAARVCGAAGDDEVLEFGLRRAQGIDGGLLASRSAYLGGAAATSNVLAGKLFGIPVRGTHAHSWVMSFDSEPEAFDAYARALPNNCVFLVDTYDTLDGVRHAIEVGRRLRATGHELLGIRLDSGDLAYLSVEARKLLDDAGFPKARIVASNDLDEHLVESLKHQGAKIAVWGVGTKLATAYDQPALGGVYKLAAMRVAGGPWVPRVKLSEQAVKTSIPGALGARRYLRDGLAVCDVIHEAGEPPAPGTLLLDPMDPTRRRKVPHDAVAEDLLVPVLVDGLRVGSTPSLAESRARAKAQLAALHPAIRRLQHPHAHPVGLSESLHDRRRQLVLDARKVRE